MRRQNALLVSHNEAAHIPKFYLDLGINALSQAIIFLIVSKYALIWTWKMDSSCSIPTVSWELQLGPFPFSPFIAYNLTTVIYHK